MSASHLPLSTRSPPARDPPYRFVALQLFLFGVQEPPHAHSSPSETSWMITNLCRFAFKGFEGTLDASSPVYEDGDTMHRHQFCLPESRYE